MSKINNLIKEIEDLERLISSWRPMILQFPEDSFLAFSLPPYENRLKVLHQELKQLKKGELILEIA